MRYFLNLYSPETYEVVSDSDKTISGFRIGQRSAAEKIQPGDRFLCYLTKVSRWVGILEIIDGPFEDTSPYYYEKDDPFILRYKVKPIVWLEKNKSLPIHESFLWDKLSFTKNHDKNLSLWTGKIRASLVQIENDDAELIAKALLAQNQKLVDYPIDEKEYKKHLRHKVRIENKVISVSVPDDAQDQESKNLPYEARDSIKVQAKIVEMGFKMGFKIWAPKSDRGSILREFVNPDFSFIDSLPLNYDDTTLQTIENIDVLWLKGRAIVRAFEVEHTTSIYSGILRMADLLALQPNMNIKLHIVAPVARREKVFSELKRPVFSLLERGPLSEYCTYLAYESINDLSQQPHLAHLSDTVLDEYVEQAD